MPHKAKFGRRTDGPTGRRRALRKRINLAVSLFSVDQSRVALLADLSQTGCRLHGMGLPEVGQEVLLKAAAVELFGRIVWKGDDERGVMFDEPISDTGLADLRKILSRQHEQESSGPDIFR